MDNDNYIPTFWDHVSHYHNQIHRAWAELYAALDRSRATQLALPEHISGEVRCPISELAQNVLRDTADLDPDVFEQ